MKAGGQSTTRPDEFCLENLKAVPDKFCGSKPEEVRGREAVVVIAAGEGERGGRGEPDGEQSGRKSGARRGGSGCREQSSESEQPFM